jgi:RND superfamily putative drug exporter
VDTIARWCFQRRRLVLLLWIVALLGTGAISSTMGTAYDSAFSLPGTDSQKALDLLKREFPALSGDDVSIVLHARMGTVRDVLARDQANAMLKKVAELPHVAGVTGPYDPDTVGQVSRDGLTAFARVSLDAQMNEVPRADLEAIVDTARAADGGPLQVELTGQPLEVVERKSAGPAALASIAAAAVVLYVAFGSALAMALPLLSATAALGVALSLIGLVSHVMGITDLVTGLAALIGLGVGIDYALFIVSRHRAGLQAGRSPQDAAVAAIRTSGRTTMFAGVIVCTAMLGMLALRVSLLDGIAVSCALVVALTMAAALTLLPAILGFLGMKVLSRRERAALEAERAALEAGVPVPGRPPDFWWRWAHRVEKHPLPLSVVAAALLLVVSIPFFSLRLGSADQGSGPESRTSKRGYDLLAEGFGPGFNGPLTLVAEIDSPADLATFGSVVAGVRATPGVISVTDPHVSPNGRAAVAVAFPGSGPQDVKTSQLLGRLRRDVIPAAAENGRLLVHVGGVTAFIDDLDEVLADKLPQFIGVIIGLAFLLLVVVFRSLLVPALASVMNLFAVAASFGLVVAVFQWGWLSDAVGVRKGPVESVLPVLMFAILFGLSMDYEVFLVSRMHEEWLARRDNRAAVTSGLARTGRVVTTAGAIMILVFASFTLSDARLTKIFGLGLALAIVIDAFVIRPVLVPALMHVFGRANWWLPSRLDRLIPRVSVEPAMAAGGVVITSAHTRRGRHRAAHPTGMRVGTGAFFRPGRAIR